MWSTSGFFARAPLFEGWPGVVLAFWRAVFACLVLLPMVRRPRWSWKLTALLIFFVLMNYTYLTAIVQAGPANAIWLQNTAPVWVFFVGVFYLKEKIQYRDWLLLLFCMLGVGVILFFEVQGESIGGVIYGLLAGVTYAGVVITLRQGRNYESVWLIALCHVVTAAALSPFVIYHNIWPSGWQWAYLAGFGIFQMGLPYVLFARGLRVVAGHEAAGLVLLEPVLVPLWVYLAWQELPSWWTFVGGGLILIGLLLRYFGSFVPRPNSSEIVKD